MLMRSQLADSPPQGDSSRASGCGLWTYPPRFQTSCRATRTLTKRTG